MSGEPEAPSGFMWTSILLSMLSAASAAPPATSVLACKQAASSSWEIRDAKLGCKAPSVMVAQGAFVDGLNVTGWGVLNIKAEPKASATDAGYGVGLLEGYLTAEHIYYMYLNVMDFTFGCTNMSCVPANVSKFMDAQEAWTLSSATSKGASDPFWRSVSMLMSQYKGVGAGYSMRRAENALPPLPPFAMKLLNGVGDLFQIIPSVVHSKRHDYSKMTRTEAREVLLRQGHCSALIRVPGALDDLLMAHSAWFEFQNTDRIFKYYTLDGVTTAFSSYPGYLESLDDFYMMSSGLGMVQTSNNVLNHTLYDLITPKSLLAWQRVRVASQMATTGEEWYRLFQRSASGTYVNQYMVVDFNRFTPGQPLRPGTLWVLEEIPGLVKGADQTPTLARGYWPSYNVPFYTEVYERSGYRAIFDDDGGGEINSTLYDGGGAEYTIGAPRSKIFRRDHGKVVDMQSYREFMRYADYSGRDPYAIEADGRVNYGAAICMRGDLADGGWGSAGGCYDSKVTSYLHGFRNLTADVVNGPSSRASSPASALKPFEWRGPMDGMHIGLPKVYDFPWVTVSPSIAQLPVTGAA